MLAGCQISDIKQKVDDMHSALTEYMPQLIRASERAADSNERIENNLIAPATAVGKIDLIIIMPVIKTLCALLLILVIWFTGLQPHLSDIFGWLLK